MESPSPVEQTFGDPNQVFAPSRGQTTLGVFGGFAIVVGGGVWALFAATTLMAQMTLFVTCSLIGIGISIHAWRMRRWRLSIHPEGLIQNHASKTEVIRWEDVIELIETRLENRPNGKPIRVKVVTDANTLWIETFNFRQWSSMFDVILESARKRGIPIRIELQSSD